LPPSEIEEQTSHLAPEDIPLPSSEVNFDIAPYEAPSGRPPTITYRRTLEGLTPLLPYLKLVENQDVRCQNTGQCPFYDYDTTLERSLLVRMRHPSSFLPSAASTKIRFIFLEDLDPDRIETIGSGLGIPPGFFASHLAGAGYGRANKDFDAGGGNLWSRIRPGKGQFSISWLRPVFLSVPLSSRLRDRLLADTHAPRLKCVFPSCEEGQSHKTITFSNILRRPVSLSSQPGSDFDKEFPVGWEEKLSVWRTDAGGCSICRCRSQSKPSNIN
jgi:hypothetical protein